MFMFANVDVVGFYRPAVIADLLGGQGYSAGKVGLGKILGSHAEQGGRGRLWPPSLWCNSMHLNRRPSI